MPVISSTYSPPALIRGGHLQTILPALFRKVSTDFRRERIELPDGDFLDLDWRESSIQPRVPNSLIILSHGLEGDTSSQFLSGMVNHLTSLGYHCLAWHYRSCSGEMNRLQRFYHLGETADLAYLVRLCRERGYEHFGLIGFSAGGNITLKYLGEQGEAAQPHIRCGVAFSTPLDLAGASRRMKRWDSLIYNRRFTKSLKNKVLAKAALQPDFASQFDVSQVRDLIGFDEAVTAPLHGFASAAQYYAESSALGYLNRIRVPTLLVSARNDPMFSPSCFPTDPAVLGPSVLAEYPAQGGHCGFPPNRLSQKVYWSERRCAEYLGGFF